MCPLVVSKIENKKGKREKVMRAPGEAGAAPAGSINTNTEWADLSPDYRGSSRPRTRPEEGFSGWFAGILNSGFISPIV